MSGSLSNILAMQPADTSATAPKALPAAISDDGTLLTQLVQWFEEAEWVKRDEREAALRDRQYLDGAQWTPTELETLRKRGQPALVINRIVRKVNYLKGFERRLRSDPKVFPRTPGYEAESDAATQALRYCCDDNGHDQIRSSVFENMVVEGYGGAEIIGEAQPDGTVDVREHHVPWDRLWYDPYSVKQNFSDARYMGTVIWMDRDQALDLYPNGANAIEQTIGGSDSVYDDNPGAINWIDSRRTRVRIVQCHWQQKGDWWTGTYTKAGFVETAQVSPYLDRRGKTCSQLRMRSAYVDSKGNRYGEVRQYISMQDELNKRRSKALHILNTRQVIASPGAVQNQAKARTELARPDGWLEVNDGQRFEIHDNQDMASGQMELLQHVSAEIDATGPNAAMAGKDPREQSGRAIQAQQQGGAVEQEPLIDSLRQWDREAYEAMFMRIRQFWTGPKWIRVTNNNQDAKWVGLNRPVTLQDELGQMPPDQRAQVMQRMQLQPNDPRLQQTVRTENDISALDVDITVEEGPDISTMQAQTFTDIMAIVQSGVQMPPAVIIELSPLPQETKDRVTEMLEKAQNAAQNQQQMAAVQQHQLAVAKLAQTQAQTASDTASASDKQASAALKVHQMAKDHAAVGASPHTVGGALDPTDVVGEPVSTLGGAPQVPQVAAPLGQPTQ